MTVGTEIHPADKTTSTIAVMHAYESLFSHVDSLGKVVDSELIKYAGLIPVSS